MPPSGSVQPASRVQTATCCPDPCDVHPASTITSRPRSEATCWCGMGVLGWVRRHGPEPHLFELAGTPFSDIPLRLKPACQEPCPLCRVGQPGISGRQGHGQAGFPHNPDPLRHGQQQRRRSCEGRGARRVTLQRTSAADAHIARKSGQLSASAPLHGSLYVSVLSRKPSLRNITVPTSSHSCQQVCGQTSGTTAPKCMIQFRHRQLLTCSPGVDWLAHTP